jgi:lipopolysaccharide/colanic/teichoic acid biosynthesis glycosyltransferase
MSPAKRAFDLVLALLLLLPGILLLAVLLALIWLREGRPLLYGSERMVTRDRAFRLWKLRTMAPGAEDGRATWSGKAARITGTGRWLRASHLDELPQLWNILRGEMSFVGPRPPLRRYVAARPDLYGEVLRCRPGLTGLATLVFSHREALLMNCPDAATAEVIYCRRCLPRKARLDLIYLRRRSLALDLWILWRTFLVVLKGLAWRR